ncbi:helix-turn-helix transcriptional regulator, partial [Candidatus Sumerlaeota bacterium]|nr:helix-turn-helix transcriptional regulator [Candidatus Sumerlaeota bacterium]
SPFRSSEFSNENRRKIHLNGCPVFGDNYSFLERGERRPTLEVCVRIANALGYSLADWIIEAEEAYRSKRKKRKS